MAIIDAFDDPSAESDLGVYRSRYGISACTSANGCFKKVNQTGGTSYPAANAGWAVEISLDLDMVSAACPNCHILLVEATNNDNGNLYVAEDEAVALGATEVSNSWGTPEEPGETSADSYFHHTGVPVTASAGDSGYEVEYPAASPDVIAVGGTTLNQASNARGWSETAWGEGAGAGTGSGCSAYEAKPAWQTDTGCPRRTNNDVAAVASPKTPLSLADSYELPKEFSKPEAGWTLAGGTSASSPLIAATMALANAFTRSLTGAEALYMQAAQNGTGVLDDVTSGSNGSCGSYLCDAGPGYDGPTGLGSPYGAPLVLPSPPTVVTGTTSSLTQTTATVNATVNPNGSNVSECRFEYGTTTAYGSSAACTSSPGSGSSPVAVSASLTGLLANTTYDFRISATNAGATGMGSDATFKTLANPPTLETNPASSLTQTTANLTAAVNPNGAAVSKCEFEYGTTNAYGSIAACSSLPGSGSGPVAVSASLTGLIANTTYHFRISATGPGGTSKGSDETFKTLPAGPAVATKAASSVAESTAILNATVNPDGGEVTECKLEYGTTTAYGSSAPCSSLPGSGSSPVAVSASLAGLIANTTYHFRISATNAGATSNGSDETFTTLPAPPTVVTGTTSSLTQTTATVNATVNPNGSNVSECRFEYGTTNAYGSIAPCSSLPGSGSSPVAVSASLTGLIANTTYHFRISATGPGGTSKGSDEAFKTTATPMSAPTVETKAASSVTETSAALNATVDPNGGSVSKCEFEYGTTNAYGSSVPCSVPTGASGAVGVAASLEGLDAATTYYFRIVAANQGGTSDGVQQTLTTLLPETLAQQGSGGEEVVPGLGAAPGVAVLPSTAHATPAMPDAKLASSSLGVSGSGAVAIMVKCPAGESSCAGTIALQTLSAVSAEATGHQSGKRRASVLTLAKGSFTVAGGKVRTLTLRLSGTARTLLSRTRVLRVRATIVAHDPAGAAHTTQTIVTLRMRKVARH